jgi:hypothetical protein
MAWGGVFFLGGVEVGLVYSEKTLSLIKAKEQIYKQVRGS